MPGQAGGAAQGSDVYTDALNEIRIQVRGADVQLERILEEGAQVRLQTATPNRFRWALRDGLLEITELPGPRRGLFGLFQGEGVRLTLGLANLSLQRLRVESYSGDIGARDLEISGQALLASQGGDIFIQRMNAQGGAEARSREGDLELIEVETDGALRVESVSGDVRVSRARADSMTLGSVSGDLELDELSARQLLQAKTASGDIQLERGGNARELRLESATGDISAHSPAGHALRFATLSGDIALDRATAYVSLSAESKSGDMSARLPDAPEITLTSISGDLDARLARRPGGWDVQAHTVAGDISMDRLDPVAAQPARVTLKTTSGDIAVRVAD